MGVELGMDDLEREYGTANADIEAAAWNLLVLHENRTKYNISQPAPLGSLLLMRKLKRIETDSAADSASDSSQPPMAPRHLCERRRQREWDGVLDDRNECQQRDIIEVCCFRVIMHNGLLQSGNDYRC